MQGQRSFAVSGLSLRMLPLEPRRTSVTRLSVPLIWQWHLAGRSGAVAEARAYSRAVTHLGVAHLHKEFEMHKRLALSAFAALALTAAMAAHADVQPGFYMGAGFGSTKIDDDGFDGIDFDDSDTGFKVFGGYSFNQNFAIEAAYFDLGEASGTFDDLGDTVNFDVGVSGFNVSAVGVLPLSDMFSLFGKLGYASYDIDAKVSIVGVGSGSDSQSESDMTYGAGASLSFAERFEARVEFEAINVDNGDANMICVSGLYRF
jgi:OOP family OmpA-OmpF porin